LVRRAEDWAWSSLSGVGRGQPASFLDPGPVTRPTGWLDWVNMAQTEPELERLRQCVTRGSPFGTEGWVQETAVRLGLEFTLRPGGRPRKKKQKT
jgi:putative transposase